MNLPDYRETEQKFDGRCNNLVQSVDIEVLYADIGNFNRRRFTYDCHSIFVFITLCLTLCISLSPSVSVSVSLPLKGHLHALRGKVLE